MKRTLLSAIIIVLGSAVFAQSRIVNIGFETTNTVGIDAIPAILKYNKDFAWSLAFDDGLRSAYTMAFPLIHGGYSEELDESFPGFYYTDGCGNRIAFSASLSIYSKKDGQDIHLESASYNLRWSDINIMHHEGWSIQNHGFDQSFENDVNYQFEIDKNYHYVLNKTGYRMICMVPPGGNSDYIQPAFSQGSLAVFTSSASHTISGSRALQADQKLPAQNPVFWRFLLNSETHSLNQFIEKADSIIDLAGPTNHLWWNEFTHRVELDGYPASVKFNDLRQYLDYLESEYGAEGKDNGWFANGTEVFEYLTVRDKSKLRLQANGNQINLSIDYSDVSYKLLNYDLSLIVTGQNLNNFECDVASGIINTKYLGNNQYLVNVDLPDGIFTAVNKPSQEAVNAIQVFPNPAIDYFRISGLPSGHTSFTVDLFNISGQLVVSQELTALNSSKIDLTKTYLPHGLYMIRVMNDQQNNIYRNTIIIQ